MEATQQQIKIQKEVPIGSFDKVDMVKRYQKFKNKLEQYNSWCLDRSVLIKALDCDSQAVDLEKAIDFQCLFC